MDQGFAAWPDMNILIIMTDQQRADCIGRNNKLLQTPALDKLAAQSVVFARAFAQSPQCQPSRAAFWTSRYPSTLRMWWNEMRLPSSERTLANIVSDAGYDTGYFGKWHLDNATDTLGHFGFNPDNSYLSEDWKEGKDLPKREAGSARREYLEIMKTQSWSAKLSNRVYQHDDVVAEKAVRFMSNCNKPFLCAIGFKGPHPPYAAPPPYCDMYQPGVFDANAVVTYNDDALSKSDMQFIKSQYYGSISWIDDNVGRIIDFVDRNVPDTVVVFTSDHGDMLGDHGHFAKGLYAYDQTVSVPLIIRAPGVGPHEYNHIVQHIDVMPTILELISKTPCDGMQGKSLVTAIRSNEAVNDFALSMVGYKPRLKMIRGVRYKYWIYGDDEYVFDLATDPGENHNLMGDAELLSRMRFNLIRAVISAEDCLPVPDRSLMVGRSHSNPDQ